MATHPSIAMPKPLSQEYILPMAIAQAAAEAYMAEEPTSDPSLSFADFFMNHNLSTADSYSNFYSPATLLKENAHLLPSGSLTDDDFEDYYRDHAFNHLLDGAAQDTAQVYRAVRQFLFREEGDVSRIVPVLQNSKTLARRIGSVDSGMGGFCLLNGANDSIPFVARRGDDNRIRQVDLAEEAKRLYIRPNIHKYAGCPLLTRLVFRHNICDTGQDKIAPVKAYDLYWDAFVKYVHTCTINGRRVVPTRIPQ